MTSKDATEENKEVFEADMEKYSKMNANSYCDLLLSINHNNERGRLAYTYVKTFRSKYFEEGCTRPAIEKLR